jgi:hypothetical protein
MDKDAYLAGVRELYDGEIIGEGLFSTLLDNCPADKRHGMGLLLQLESEAKVKLRPMLLRLGLPIAESAAMRSAGVEFAGKLRDMEWADGMRMVADLSRPYLERYKVLAAAAEPADRELTSFMVAHEQAVVDFAELEAAGQSEAAAETVTRLLETKLPQIT